MNGSRTRLAFFFVVSSQLAPIAAAAQQTRAHAPLRSRLLALPISESGPIWADPSGEVRLVGEDASDGVLVRITASGAVQVEPLGGHVTGISSDGTILAGRAATPQALYFEGAWWDVAPVALHTLGGDIRSFSAVARTSSGLVLVGSDGFGSQPFDWREQGEWGALPGLSGTSTEGFATGVSLDGSTYSGQVGLLGSHAVRWVNRQALALDEGDAAFTTASGVAPDGTSFVGSAYIGGSFQPAVWLGSDGLALRALTDFDGAPFAGQAAGILADGLVYGSGTRAGQGFGWVWKLDRGSSRVTRFDDWFAYTGGLQPTVPITGVRGMCVRPRSYHCSLAAGQQAWYAEVPRL